MVDFKNLGGNKMEWINRLPQELQEAVRAATKGLNLVDANSGEWVPASKISDLTAKHKKAIEDLKNDSQGLQSKLDGFKDYEELKNQVQSLTDSNEQLILSNGLRQALTKAGAAYPDLLIKAKGKLDKNMDFATVTEELKNEFPLSFKVASTSGAGSNTQGKQLTDTEQKQLEINQTFNKPNKSFNDYVNIVSKLGNKE